MLNIVPRPCGRVDGNQSRFKGLFSAVQKGLPPLLLLYSSFCFLNVFFHIFFVSFFAFSSFLNSWQFFRQTFSQKKNNSNSSKTGSQTTTYRSGVDFSDVYRSAKSIDSSVHFRHSPMPNFFA